MQTVLQKIAKQANLERILFSPGLKKLYFDLAVGAGGTAQFKHADSIRNGLTSITKDIDREKTSLLFCHTHELVPAYDMMLHTAMDLHPVAVLAVRGGNQPVNLHWSDLELRRSGWIVFYTHTLQELYDHLAMTYHIFAETKFALPVLIIHSALQHKSTGEWKPKEGINLGAPTGDFTHKKTGPKSFADAFAAMEKKKSPPSLHSEMVKVIPALRDVYTEFGYTLPCDGFPFSSNISANDTAVISPFPVDDESTLNDAAFDFVRPFCAYPMANDAVVNELSKKKCIAVMDPPIMPGTTIPSYYAEWAAAFSSGFSGKLLSIVLPKHVSLLSHTHVKAIQTIIENHLAKPDQPIRFYALEI